MEWIEVREAAEAIKVDYPFIVNASACAGGERDYEPPYELLVSVWNQDELWLLPGYFRGIPLRSNVRHEIMSVSVTREHKKQLTAFAKSKGVSVSSLIREWITEKLA